MFRGSIQTRFPAALVASFALIATPQIALTAAFAADPSTSVELTILDTTPGSAPETPWDGLLNQDGGSHVFFGVNLLGPSPYARNAGTEFRPASNTKLFTGGAALERLGPDFRFETRLQWRRVDPAQLGAVSGLTLIGSGDPSWGMPELGETLRTRLDGFAAALAAKGVTEVHGELGLQAEDARWDTLRYPQGWTPDEYTACYAALAQAFMLQLGCATFKVTGLAAGAWVEPGVTIPVTLALKAGAHTRIEVEAVGPPSAVSRGFVLRGTWAAGSVPQTFSLPIHDTRSWVRNLWRRSLSDQGLRLVTGEAEPEPLPAGSAEPETLVFYSPPLSAILKPFLKESINQIGDALFKTLGRHFGDPAAADLLAAGEGVMRDYVAGLGQYTALKLNYRPLDGFFSGSVTLHDGSGISQDNQVTTPAVMALLRDLNGRATFSALWDSLPIAGVDGTLASRMRNTPAQGVLRAKTGTLTGVYNLSGYVPRYAPGGGIIEYVPFVILSSTTSEHRVEARAAQDRVGAALAGLVNPGP